LARKKAGQHRDNRRKHHMAKKSKSLSDLVGKNLRIEREGVVFEGMLVEQETDGRWKLFHADDFANTTEHIFSERGGWTVTEIGPSGDDDKPKRKPETKTTRSPGPRDRSR
jgi:hypothetical protein